MARCKRKSVANNASQGNACTSKDANTRAILFFFLFRLIASETCGEKNSAAEKCENLHLLSSHRCTVRFVSRSEKNKSDAALVQGQIWFGGAVHLGDHQCARQVCQQAVQRSVGGNAPCCQNSLLARLRPLQGNQLRHGLLQTIQREVVSRDRKSTRLNSSHPSISRMPSSA